MTSPPPPKQFQYLLALYNLLVEGANGDTFTGSMTATFKTLGVSNVYNPKLYRILMELGCIELKQRGSSHHPSIIRLIGPPALEDYTEKQHSARVNRRLTKRAKVDNLELRVDTIERRLPSIDLNQYVIALEQRLAEIEARLPDKGGTDFASPS